LPTDDVIREGDVQEQNADNITSGKKRGLFGRDARVNLEDEGILLQPDFEFDEDGNIIEFDASHLSPRKRRKVSPNLMALEGPAFEEIQDNAVSL
jgi:meiotic recombination protein REC8